MAMIEAWVAPAAESNLVRQKVELGPLGVEELEAGKARYRIVLDVDF